MNWEQESGGVKRADELLVSLGESDWTVRQNAVRGLTAQAADDAIAKLLIVVREQHRDLARLNAALQVLVRTPADVSPELIRLLSHPDHEVRAYAALALGDRGDPTAIEALIAALADADANVRMNAVEALGKLRAGAAVDALIGFVDALDFELAFPAIDALGAIGDQRIAYRLLPLLRQPLYKVAAIQALAALGDEEVVQPLLDLLADPEVPPAEVATALVRMHRRYQRRHGDQHTIPEAVRALASPASVQALVAAAAQVSVSAGGGGPTLLSWLAGPGADEALVASLDRPALGDEAVAAIVRRGPSIVPLLLSRIAAAGGDALRAILEALAQLGDRAAVPALLQSMPQAEEEDLLVCFVDTLARLCDPRAYQPLRGLFGHPSARVRQAAAAAVNSLAHPNTASDLLAGLADPSPLIRESNLRVAGYVGPPQCLESLLECCGAAEERVRRAAIEALPIYDDPRVRQRLMQAVGTDTPAVRAAAAVALARCENVPAASQLLAGLLQDADVWVRYFAIRSLLAIQAHGGFISELTQLASNDPAMQVRLAAIEALGECGALALPTLLDLSNAEASDLAGAALAALGASGQAEAIQRLVEALQSPDTERRILAARALARTGSPEAVGPLLAAALGSDERTAAEAIGALAQLGIPAAAAALIDISRLPGRREKCIDALAAMAGTAVPALAQSLFQGDLDVRRAIVEILSRIGQPAAVDALEVALNDREAAVRHAALSALAHIRQVSREQAPRTGTPSRASEGEA